MLHAKCRGNRPTGPRCYTPSVVEIGRLVPEKKISEGFLTYMYMDLAAILVTFVPPIQGGST